MYQQIIVPVDGSESAKRAVREAARLAHMADAKLELLNIVPRHGRAHLPRNIRAFDQIEHATLTQEDIFRDAANEIIEDARSAIAEPSLQIETSIEFGPVAPTIVSHAANQEADLIVMGSRGVNDLQGLLLGSVSHRVLQLAECPVMLVK